MGGLYVLQDRTVLNVLLAQRLEITAEGTTDTFSITYFAIAGLSQKQVPYCLACVNLDGRDTAIAQCVSGIEFEKIDKDRQESKS